MLPDYESKGAKGGNGALRISLPSVRCAMLSDFIFVIEMFFRNGFTDALSPFVWLLVLLAMISLLSFFLIGHISDFREEDHLTLVLTPGDLQGELDRHQPPEPQRDEQVPVARPVIPSPPPVKTETQAQPFPHTEAMLDNEDVYTVKIPHVVSYDDPNEPTDIREKRDAVRQAFTHAYGGYEQRCMGKGELKPISGKCHDWLVTNMGLSIMDSLDTMLIMGLNDHYIRGRDYLKKNLNFNADITVSLFETNIRCLGGLLAAYDYTKDPFLLSQAESLAGRLMPAFNTNTGIPKPSVNLRTGATSSPPWTGGSSILAEIGTLQLEWGYLGAATKKPIYAEKALKVFEHLRQVMPSDKLFPVFINADRGSFTNSLVTLGALGDSFYEYLLKYWLITGKKASNVGRWYYDVAEQLINVLGKATSGSIDSGEGMYFFRERNGGSLSSKFDHLACFAGGMFALGAVNSEKEDVRKRHLQIGEGVAALCEAMYAATKTGLPYESVFVGDRGPQPGGGGARYYLQRPEAVEAWFYMWRLTKKPIYREWGWKFFQALEQVTKMNYGYTGLHDADNPKSYDDMQQSFFLAETLKYLFLLFCPDDVIPLDEFVFTTEAHPLSHFEPNYYPKL